MLNNLPHILKSSTECGLIAASVFQIPFHSSFIVSVCCVYVRCTVLSVSKLLKTSKSSKKRNKALVKTLLRCSSSLTRDLSTIKKSARNMSLPWRARSSCVSKRSRFFSTARTMFTSQQQRDTVALNEPFRFAVAIRHVTVTVTVCRD